MAVRGVVPCALKRFSASMNLARFWLFGSFACTASNFSASDFSPLNCALCLVCSLPMSPAGWHAAQYAGTPTTSGWGLCFLTFCGAGAEETEGRQHHPLFLAHCHPVHQTGACNSGTMPAQGRLPCLACLQVTLSRHGPSPLGCAVWLQMCFVH